MLQGRRFFLIKSASPVKLEKQERGTVQSCCTARHLVFR
jgi:hypothetical protein